MFQLVPAIRKMDGTFTYFPNNGCHNPVRLNYNGVGGSLMVYVNDRKGTYGDNAGSFDVHVEIVERLPF